MAKSGEGGGIMSVGVTVTTTTGVRADISAKVQASIGVKAQVSIDVKVQTQAVALASVECLAEMRDQLLVAGEIRIEDEPELEDVEEIDEESAELEMKIERMRNRQRKNAPPTGISVCSVATCLKSGSWSPATEASGAMSRRADGKVWLA